MLRFAILEHDYPALHWDLLLENGDVLLSWRLSAPPAPRVDVAAEKSLAHRPLYLDYEGEVSDGRGRVIRWDGGTFQWKEQGPDKVTVHLAGLRLRGFFSLERSLGERWCGRFTADVVAES